MNLTRLLPLIVALSVLGAAARAEEKPLFEMAVIGGAGYLPDYPAAGQNHLNGIALPVPIYRGSFFRADSSGVRGRLHRSRDLELDISLGGSLDADSDNNDARTGMPDLDHLAEFGPRLQWTVARAARWAKIELELPLRAVFSTDFSSVEHQGFLIEPQLAYQHENFLASQTKLKLGFSVVFADEELQDYFYEVEARFATASRPAYDGQGGYLGSRLRLLLLRPFGKRLKLFAAADLNSHQGAANQDSPLFREDLTFGAGLGLIWSFFQSDRMVDE
ncbi:MAG: MipA/OmpV family protein [Alphaproteobacteria bacterium]|nr:MipA/OmpV family protein [Alphaproteobacteria bacterium]